MIKEIIKKRVQPIIDMVNYELKLQNIHAKNTLGTQRGGQINFYHTYLPQKSINIEKINKVLRRAKASKQFSSINATIQRQTGLLVLNFELNPDIIFDQDFIEKGEYKKIKNRINLLRGLKIRAGKNHEIKDYILEGFPVEKKGRFADLMRDDEDYRLLFQRYIDYFFTT